MSSHPMAQQTPTTGAVRQRRSSTFNLRALLEEMIQRGASDLHITAGEKPKLRIDGELAELERRPCC